MIKNKTYRYVKAGALALFLLLMSSCQGVPLLDPQGPIGTQNRDLLMIAVGLGFLVVIPVIIMTIWFAIRYRETNAKATYKPHWEGSLKIEAVIWLVPIAIIVVLSYLTWVKTTELDPYRPIPSAERPMRVQVISLDWNWLFIYPDYDIASVNKLVIPTGTPVTFDLTSATVMTSFFIPDLGSQMYVMAGMVSHLNLQADKPGTFTGKNMEFSGSGYSQMNFPAVAVSSDQFKAWTTEAKATSAHLTQDQFNQLNKPQSNYPATSYSSVEPGLFDHLVGKFMKTRGNEAMMKVTNETMSPGASAMPMTTSN